MISLGIPLFELICLARRGELRMAFVDTQLTGNHHRRAGAIPREHRHAHPEPFELQDQFASRWTDGVPEKKGPGGNSLGRHGDESLARLKPNRVQ